MTEANLRSGPHSTFLESFLTVWAETCTIMILSSCGVSMFLLIVLAHMSRQPAVLLQGASQQVRTYHRSEAAIPEQLLWAVGKLKPVQESGGCLENCFSFTPFVGVIGKTAGLKIIIASSWGRFISQKAWRYTVINRCYVFIF